MTKTEAAKRGFYLDTLCWECGGRRDKMCGPPAKWTGQLYPPPAGASQFREFNGDVDLPVGRTLCWACYQACRKLTL